MFGTHDKLNEDGLRYEHRGSKSVVDRKVHCLVHPRDIEPKCVVSELLTHPYAAIYCPRFYQQAENFLGVCSSSPFPQLGLDELPVLPSTVKRRLQLAIHLTGPGDSTDHARQAIIDVVHRIEPRVRLHDTATRPRGKCGSTNMLITRATGMRGSVLV